MPYHTFAVSLMLVVVLQSSSWAQVPASEVAVTVLSEVAYKLDADTDYEQNRCKLDWYLPTGKKDFATIVWFHGGGLQNGQKAGQREQQLANRFARDGIAVASVNYRLSPKVKFPAYIEDAAAAVAFVVKHAEEHGGSKDRVFVSGHSAGGYLTAMIGMDPQYLEQHGLSPSSLAGYMPVAGQMITHSTVRGERGIPRTQPIIDSAAPLYFATSDRPPFLCIVGSNDMPARAEENRYFVAAMKAAKHNSITYLEVEGRDHGSIAFGIPNSDDVVAKRMIKFIGE